MELESQIVVDRVVADVLADGRFGGVDRDLLAAEACRIASGLLPDETWKCGEWCGHVSLGVRGRFFPRVHGGARGPGGKAT